MFKKLKYRIKYARNNILEYFYNKIDSQSRLFFERYQFDKNKVQVISITFQNPTVTQWQIKQIKTHCADIELLIFDNSRDDSLANQIKLICEDEKVFYFRLPVNNVKHANRSHGMAMNWIYRQFITLKQPDYFGFIDHDLIPLSTFAIRPKLMNKPFYGILYAGGRETWQTWAGYTFFDRKFMENKEINFMYHFEIGLDTGGFNYESIYKPTLLIPEHYAPNESVTFNLPEGECAVQMIDDVWFHIGGIGYGDNYANKQGYVKSIMALIENEVNILDELAVSRKTIPANILFNGKLI